MWLPKQTTRIYHSIKITVVHAVDACHLKSKTVAKLNSTEMDLRSRSARLSRRDNIRDTVIIQEMKVTWVTFRWHFSKKLK